MPLYATSEHSSTISPQDEVEIVGLLQCAIGDVRLQRIHLHVLSLIVAHGGEWPGHLHTAAMAGVSKRSLSQVLTDLRGAGYLIGHALSVPKHVPPVRNYSAMRSALRNEAIIEFGQKCVHCGGLGTDRQGPDQKSWSLDRIVPGTAGGHYQADNVALSCVTCNTRRNAEPAHAKMFSLADWRALKAQWQDVGAEVSA